MRAIVKILIIYYTSVCLQSPDSRGKEEKMTGLVFSGGKGPAADRVRAVVDELGGERLIAAADSGLDAAERAGLQPDWIVGDMDSLGYPDRLAAYSHEQVLRYPAEKDFTDTELAFTLLREKGCADIWIIGGGGGRVDHLFGIRSMCEREEFPRRWILHNADIYCVQAEELLTLRLRTGAVVSVFPLADGPWKAQSQGLKWPLDGLQWNRGFIGVSNTAVDGELALHIQQGRFMVIAPGNCE